MKKIFLSLALFSILTCTPANATGLLYTDATYPIMATGVKTTKDIRCLKRGCASAKSILFLVELGNAGLAKAAKNGCIEQVYFVDVHEKSVFIFFREITTTVYGE